MITLGQIKAARALLGWTQERLAQLAGISLPAINNIERGITTPRRETLQQIEAAFTEAGIDFIDYTGVRLRPPELETRIIDGPNWLKEYDELIVTHMRSAEDLICQLSCDEQLWMTYGSTTNHHYIDHRNTIGFKERIIVPKNTGFVTNQRSVYRHIDPMHIGSVSWQVFDTYTAQIIWSRQQIVLIRSHALADSQRRLFDVLWNESKPFSGDEWSKLEKWDYTGNH